MLKTSRKQILLMINLWMWSTVKGRGLGDPLLLLEHGMVDKKPKAMLDV